MQALVLIALALIFCSFSAHADDATLSRGAYLARAGDCTSCHTEPGKPLYAGGFAVNSPFGVIYGTNITPDPTYGIGNYTLTDFTRAVRQGIAKDGHRLYPAMPYTSFAKVSDEDIAMLYDYFMHEVQPIAVQPQQTHLPFPFNQRWAIIFWDWAFAPDKRFVQSSIHDEQWNRGAYLVQSLAHCGACHTPRGPAFEERGTTEQSPYFLHGQTLDHWAAANLSGDVYSGLGTWSEDDIASFLKNGYGHNTVAFGDMKLVVENSTQYLTADDRQAIGHYIKSLKAEGDPSSYHADATPAMFEKPGAGLYASSCAGCHQADGSGKSRAYPALAGNGAVLSGDATSVMRIVLEGSTSPQTRGTPKAARMPAFQNKFTDREIADTVTFIRQSWGNNASAVTESQVSTLRKQIQKTQDNTPGN